MTMTPHLDIDLDTASVLVTRAEAELTIVADMPGVVFGVPGLTGPPGKTGLVKVVHNADPDVPRPDYPLVYWVGSVQPNNADPDDLLMLKD